MFDCEYLINSNPEWIENNGFLVDGQCNVIHSSAFISSDVEMGELNFIGPNVCLGMPPENLATWSKANMGLKIGSRNVLNGSCAIDAGAERKSIIGSNIFIMKGVHVGHDSRIDDHVILGAKAMIGGHCRVMEYANIGMAAVIHQRHLVGAASWVGMAAVAAKTREILPYKIFSGNPGRVIGLNEKGILRAGYTDEDLKRVLTQYQICKVLLDESGFAGEQL